MKRFFSTRPGAFVLLLILLVVSEAVGFALEWLVFDVLKLIDAEHLDWRPSLFIIFESLTFLGILAGAIVVAKLGPRSLRELTFDPKGWPAKLLEGSLWGLAMPTVLIVAIAMLGGFTFGSLAMHGTTLIQYVVAWLVASFFLGLAEEAMFRGPALRLLIDAIGFWPAAIVSSFLFAWVHYVNKPHENLQDLLSIGLIGLFLCYTVKRTGSLWWAVGFHALFDYAALFLYGAPNSGNHGGQPLATKLLTGGYHGPVWLTGGILGIEASYLIFPLLAIATATYVATMRGTLKEEET